jgi:site-specific recombinase XerD
MEGGESSNSPEQSSGNIVPAGSASETARPLGTCAGPRHGTYTNLAAALEVIPRRHDGQQTTFHADVAEFLAWQESQGVSNGPIRTTATILNRFVLAVMKAGRQGWEEVTPEDVRKFMGAEERSARHWNTKFQRRSKMRRFLAWMAGTCATLPPQAPSNIRQPKMSDVDKTFTAGEIRALREAGGKPPIQLVIELGYGSGMRAGEIAGLEQGQVDAVRRIAVVRLKGRTRMVHLTSRAVELIAAWNRTQRRQRARPGSPGTVLLTRQGTAPSNKDVNRWIQEQALRAGIKRRVTSHMMRHTFGAELMEHGAQIETISRLMGHADERTTRRYTVARPEWAEQQLEKFHPAHAKGRGSKKVSK